MNQMKMHLPFLLFLFALLLTSYSCESSSHCACLSYLEKKETMDSELLIFTKAIDIRAFRELIHEDEVELLTSMGAFFKPNFIIDDVSSYSSPQLGFSSAEDTARVNSFLYHYLTQLNPRDKPQFFWGNRAVRYTNDNSDYYCLYASFETDNAGLTSVNVQRARRSEDPNDGSIGVSISIDKEGAEIWGEYTANHIGDFIAIISYNKVLSVPVIRSPIRGGETRISDGYSEREADDLADLFNCNAYAHSIGFEEFDKLMMKCR
jgi:hypothetical protein